MKFPSPGTLIEGYYGVGIDYDKLVAGERNEANEYLERKVAELKEQGITQIRCVMREGMASDEIIALGRDMPHSLIAMCSHGRTGMERWVLGSVTETVLRHGDGPVLVVRTK